MGERRSRIEEVLQAQTARYPKVSAKALNRWMADIGPGAGEYWALAVDEPAPPHRAIPPELKPAYVLVPVCTTERTKGEPPTVFRLEIKGLDIATCGYFRGAGTASGPADQ